VANTIKLLGYTYTVNLVEEANEMRASGHLHTGKQVIRVALDQCMEGKISTLIHEVIHAITWHQQVEMTEEDLMRLETGFHSFLKDNNIDLTPLEKVVCGSKRRSSTGKTAK